MNMETAAFRFEQKMKAASVPSAAILAFQRNYRRLVEGETGLIPENSIDPVRDVPRHAELEGRTRADSRLLSQTVVIKLNGGLGTSMGLERAKSLLPVKDGRNFLDFIARQILHLRAARGAHVRFALMNSFSTSRDTMEHLARYPDLMKDGDLELMQSRAPKVDARTLDPVAWPENPDLEWCPPGHGDLYPSLAGSGMLDRLVAGGVRYLFVSNSDNLGATLDMDLLGFFAASDLSFLMEVTGRTAADRKGGHLARRRSDGKLLLRESAQCPEADQEAFQDIGRHVFFNTNNLWIRLDHLQDCLEKHGGFLPLPMIKNAKTVNPRDRSSAPVFQLETAMGAAIECFEKSGAVVVPRGRFAPVKTTSDLLVLRSDACEVAGDFSVSLAAACEGRPPVVKLDGLHARFVEQLDRMTARGVPSLARCRRLEIEGPVAFEAGVVFQGRVKVLNAAPEMRFVPAGVHRDVTLKLG